MELRSLCSGALCAECITDSQQSRGWVLQMLLLMLCRKCVPNQVFHIRRFCSLNSHCSLSGFDLSNGKLVDNQSVDMEMIILILLSGL